MEDDITDELGIGRRTVLKATGFAGLLGAGGLAGTALGQQGERLTWWAGGTGGTYFPLSNEFKTIVDEGTDYTLQVQSTGASVENVGGLARGEADFALIQNDVAYFAYNGTGIEEFQGNAVPNLRGVATLYPETIHIVTRPGTDIETLQDLEGATINTGDLGSGTQVNALQILEAVGIEEGDFTEQNTGFSQAADQLRNEDIDAAFVVGGWPVGAIEELATTTDVSFVEVTEETRQTLFEQAQWFAADTIPEGTYSGQEQAVETVAVQAMIATNEGVSEEVVNAVTAAIFDNADELTIKTDFISVDSAMDGMSIPVHAGAEAYFEEQDVEVPTNFTAPQVGNETAPPGNATMDNETGMAGNETVDGNETAGDETNASG